MKIQLTFNSPFYGVIYAKGFYKVKSCRFRGHGESEIVYVLPFNGCGMQTLMEGQNLITGKMKLNNIIIVMFDSVSGVLEAQDTAFKTSCVMGGSGNNVLKAKVDVPMIDATKEILPDTLNLPPAWMKIVKGKDPFESPAHLLHLGQIGTIVISATSLHGLIDIFAFNCYAHDGMGMGLIQLIDEYGCPLHGKLIGPQAKTEYEDKIILFAHFKVFKFPDVQNVFFECSIKFCHHKCPPVNCNGYKAKIANKSYRKKRSISNISRVEMDEKELTLNETILLGLPEKNVSTFHLFQSISIAMPEYEYANIMDSKANSAIIKEEVNSFEVEERAAEARDNIESNKVNGVESINVTKYCLSRVTITISCIILGCMAAIAIIIPSSVIYYFLSKSSKDDFKLSEPPYDKKKSNIFYMMRKLSSNNLNAIMPNNKCDIYTSQQNCNDDDSLKE
ncbi:unnamed protein product [Gordionus sp. m RMFG-2023]